MARRGPIASKRGGSSVASVDTVEQWKRILCRSGTNDLASIVLGAQSTVYEAG